MTLKYTYLVSLVAMHPSGQPAGSGAVLIAEIPASVVPVVHTDKAVPATGMVEVPYNSVLTRPQTSCLSPGRMTMGSAVAFNHPLLDSSERLLIRAHKDQAQLAECLASISQTRDDKANSAARKFAVIAFVASLAYSGIAVLFSLAVVYLQNEVVLSGA